MREGLLALLRDGPSYGYQLKTAFEAATGGVWSLNVGQVYATLDRLHRDGLVDVDESNGQKQYRLTAEGREALGEWWTATNHRADPPPRDELQLKILLAIRHGPDHALEVITRHRTALTRLLQERQRATRPGSRRRNERPVTQLAAAVVADALVLRAEADLRWLDQCESRVLRHRDATGNGAPMNPPPGRHT